jgi:CelD/BcsL family acetyltransferase involved in cellulose biosynthesis
MAPSNPMLQVECVADERHLAGLQREWDELWSRSASRSFFLTYDWTRCGWDELRAANEIRIFVVRDAGRALLIAPFMKSCRLERGLPTSCLTFIEHPEAQITDLVTCSEDVEGRAVRALFHHLLHQAADWHLLSLDKIPEASPTVKHLRQLAALVHEPCELQPSHEAYYLPLDGTWEQYLNSRSTRFRKTLRNIVNRSGRLGGQIEVKRHAGSEISSSVLQKVFSVSDSSWKLVDGVAMTSQPPRMRFFEDIISSPIQRAAVEIWLLEVDALPIASEIQVVDGPVVYALRSDYDEHYADFSPGALLQIEILKQLFGSRQEFYNFGVGLNPYKVRWTDARLSLVKFRAYNKCLYGRLLRSVHGYDLAKLRRVPGLKSLHNYFSRRPL